MPTSAHNMPSDLSPASYGGGGHVNNISPNALSNYHNRGPMVGIQHFLIIIVPDADVQIKLFLHINICYGYSLEVPQ